MTSGAREPADVAGRWFTVLWMALLWLIGGVVDLVSILFNAAGDHRAWQLVGGVVAVIAGLILLGNPFVGTVLVATIEYYLIAIAAIANGVINIVGRLQGISGWGPFVLGIVKVIIGIFFLLNPWRGLRDFIPMFGLVVAVGGLLTIGAAVLGRRLPKRAAGPA